MIYYTQLIFIREGKEKLFHQFEDNVLPLLKNYRGKLMLRWRRTKDCIIEDAPEQPYEVHLVSFDSKEDFMGYANDEKRKSFLSMKDNSVEKILLIEGKVL